MSELIEFLLARIAEEETIAAKAFDTRHAWIVQGDRVVVGLSGARVLKECAVKRSIIELHSRTRTDYPPRFDEFDPPSVQVCAACSDSRERWAKPGCKELRLLAGLWSEHADFREEWR